jgi:RNA polymerase sporulation-specific sigma factor
MNDLKNYTDEELICRLRAGEDFIEEYLLEKYKPFVKSKSRALFLVGGDKEDLIQEGMIGLFKAIRDYNPENGAPFAAFAKLCVERQIYTAIEAAGRMKNAPLNAYISLSEESETLMDGGIEDAVIEKTSFQQMYLAAQAHLSKMEKEVLSFFLEGKEYTEIAEILGKTDKSIDNALQRIKTKIRKISLPDHA